MTEDTPWGWGELELKQAAFQSWGLPGGGGHLIPQICSVRVLGAPMPPATDPGSQAGRLCSSSPPFPPLPHLGWVSVHL